KAQPGATTSAMAAVPATAPALALPATAQDAFAAANQIRRENGLPEMRPDPLLSAVAQAHAEDMQRRNYFEHNTPEGVTPFQRMEQAGVQFNAAAENIAEGAPDAQAAFKLWLDSPPHRKNLLNNIYGRQGIGFAGGYWVHDFAN
ncbi:MAG: CAP domain-containing protein, partial [Bdellovibrionota bacterium]